MRPREARAARLVGEALYVGGMMILIAGALVLAMMGWAKARTFLSRFVGDPDGPAIAMVTSKQPNVEARNHQSKASTEA